MTLAGTEWRDGRRVVVVEQERDGNVYYREPGREMLRLRTVAFMERFHFVRRVVKERSAWQDASR